MKSQSYDSMKSSFDLNRRDFLRIGGAFGIGLLLGNTSAWAQENQKVAPPAKIKTNIDDALKTFTTGRSLPGPFPGRVVEVCDQKAMANDRPVPEVVRTMFEKGVRQLTGKNLKKSFGMFFEKGDVVGIKVNPVGAGLINTRLEVVDATIEWLTKNGIKPDNIVIWDRYDFMLKEAGFTSERYPGVGIVGLQTMGETEEESGQSEGGSKAEGEGQGRTQGESTSEGKNEGASSWLDKNGNHVSAGNFDMDVYYWADVEGPKDKAYLNQHVFNGKYSYFGKLLTQRLTKIVNIPVFKNSGNGISMATKNLGYGSICNTNRLHNPLFFDVCTEVLAFPVIRTKLVLNITDGLRAQYDGGPMPVAEFAYPMSTLFFATDPFALDMTCHRLMVEKRKSMQVKVNEHPIFTDYFRYAERLGLGIADPEKIEHVRI
ncbi:MAG: DUF362 domain-containing protein [Candidatus Eisenbacteria bacterium]|nr:DUF362 domain-containing protein [Candidatus Eisenbacteria bacterium]